MGEHEGHNVYPHDHHAQDLRRPAKDWCSGKWLCLSCADLTLPRGVWFTGPKCAAPKPVKS